jgi:four helix bundle protein
MERRNNLYDKALELAKEIIITYRDFEKRGIEKEGSKQFLRSGTSVGANISEAQGSVSEADYISKIHIAYKELLETQYWIELLTSLNDINEQNSKKLNEMTLELSKILYTIMKNIRNKKESR